MFEDIHDARSAHGHLQSFNVQGRYLLVAYHSAARLHKKRSLREEEEEEEEQRGRRRRQQEEEEGDDSAFVICSLCRAAAFAARKRARRPARRFFSRGALSHAVHAPAVQHTAESRHLRISPINQTTTANKAKMMMLATQR